MHNFISENTNIVNIRLLLYTLTIIKNPSHASVKSCYDFENKNLINSSHPDLSDLIRHKREMIEYFE